MLFEQEVKVRGCLVLFLEASYLMSLVESDAANAQQKAVYTILNPMLKLFAAKESLKVISEGLEIFGGVGYQEDSGLPSYLRNAQVLVIWEGTTNVLCLEIVKSFQQMGAQGLEYFCQWVRYTIDMAYLHPSEILYAKKFLFKSFQKTVYLYNALMPLLTIITEEKGRSRLNLSFEPVFAVFTKRYHLLPIQPLHLCSSFETLYLHRIRRQFQYLRGLGRKK